MIRHDIGAVWMTMKAVLRSARQIVNVELAALNLTGAEGDILFHLLAEKSGLSQENLAERLDIGKAAVSRTVHALENKGYVHREKLTDDARTYRVTVSDTAKIARSQIRKAYETVYEVALRGISEPDFQHLAMLLNQVHTNVNARVTKR
ncbi:MAG: MarR family transcriptional regulator [Kiritimatiellae bacterium]|nr:MarR family transcriptional regulator [Kiritimatiellia bacterium]